jgi:hypothetical protein
MKGVLLLQAALVSGCCPPRTTIDAEPCVDSCTRWSNGCKIHAEAMRVAYCPAARDRNCFGTVCKPNMQKGSPEAAQCVECVKEQVADNDRCEAQRLESVGFCARVADSCNAYCGARNGESAETWKKLKVSPLEGPKSSPAQGRSL